MGVCFLVFFAFLEGFFLFDIMARDKIKTQAGGRFFAFIIL